MSSEESDASDRSNEEMTQEQVALFEQGRKLFHLHDGHGDPDCKSVLGIKYIHNNSKSGIQILKRPRLVRDGPRAGKRWTTRVLQQPSTSGTNRGTRSLCGTSNRGRSTRGAPSSCDTRNDHQPEPTRRTDLQQPSTRSFNPVPKRSSGARNTLSRVASGIRSMLTRSLTISGPGENRGRESG